MKVATWNINGVKARLPVVIEWLRRSQPDVACLQEIKSVDEAFPRSAFEDLGYNVETHGQKGFNGVALLSRAPFEEVNRGLPGDEADEQARFIEGVLATERGPLRLVSLYLPNGNPTDMPKYDYKLAWMERLIAWTKHRLALEEAFVLLGDYNVIPSPADKYDTGEWDTDALWMLPSRERLRALRGLGLRDAIEAIGDAPGRYTFWDYQAGARPRNLGFRIDHALLSPQAMDRLVTASIEDDVRDWEKPSDHVPVVVQLDYGMA